MQMKNDNGKFIFHYILNKLVGFEYTSNSGTREYLYIRNIQGDITSIIDTEGNIICTYTYDGYGNHIVLDENGKEDTSLTSIGHLNPFRYRGYFFDEESGLYYLNSRYYDPETGRFISPDVLSILDETKGQINGLNLYMYCNDNPIMFYDPNGNFAIGAFLMGLAVSSLVSWGLTQIFGAQIFGGMSSIVNGASAILTSVSLFAFGPIGWVIGGIGIVAGLTSIAFGIAEIQEGLGYGNWLKSIGITGNLYNGLYIGSNIASSLVTIGGNIYRNSRITSGTGQANKTGKAYSRYYQMKDDKVVSITHYGKGGYRNYRIDLVGRTHKVPLPHKHNYYVYNEYLNKGPIDKINYILWLLMGNWR